MSGERRCTSAKTDGRRCLLFSDHVGEHIWSPAPASPTSEVEPVADSVVKAVADVARQLSEVAPTERCGRANPWDGELVCDLFKGHGGAHEAAGRDGNRFAWSARGDTDTARTPSEVEPVADGERERLAKWLESECSADRDDDETVSLHWKVRNYRLRRAAALLRSPAERDEPSYLPTVASDLRDLERDLNRLARMVGADAGLVEASLAARSVPAGSHPVEWAPAEEGEMREAGSVPVPVPSMRVPAGTGEPVAFMPAGSLMRLLRGVDEWASVYRDVRDVDQDAAVALFRAPVAPAGQTFDRDRDGAFAADFVAQIAAGVISLPDATRVLLARLESVPPAPEGKRPWPVDQTEALRAAFLSGWEAAIDEWEDTGRLPRYEETRPAWDRFIAEFSADPEANLRVPLAPATPESSTPEEGA